MGRGGGEFPEEVLSRVQDRWRKGGNLILPPTPWLSEALDRFHGLLQKTPTHGFSKPVQLNIFIDDLWPHSKKLLNAAAGGKIKLNTLEEGMDLIKNISDHTILCDRAYTPTKKSLLELTSQDAMLAQNIKLEETLA